jgi:F420-dependent oxidoreductase-like protein
MKIGLQINRFTWPGEPQSIHEILTDIATTADQGGFFSIWVMDHFFQIGYIGKPEEPMMEAYTTLGFLAGITKKAMLGTMVTGVIYRNPTLLIKSVTALDVLSNGRAYFGVGAAWNEEESHALGFAFPPLKVRFEQLEDTLQLAKQMWNDDDKTFKGKQFAFPRPINHPQAIQKPHPPILIGGGGEKKTLRLVAQYADACNLFVRMGEEELNRKLDILKEHCKEVGRNYDDIEKTALHQVDPNFSAKEVIEELKKMKNLGFSQIMIGIPHMENNDPVKRIAEEVIPQVAKI